MCITGVAALGWPSIELEHMGATYFFPGPKATHEDVSWLCVLDLSEWEMQPIVWHSPAHLK